MFIAVDENISKEAIGTMAKLGFDLIIARPGEMDIDFLERAIYHNVAGFLSLDTDIPSMLDRRNISLPWAKSPHKLRELIYNHNP